GVRDPVSGAVRLRELRRDRPRKMLERGLARTGNWELTNRHGEQETATIRRDLLSPCSDQEVLTTRQSTFSEPAMRACLVILRPAVATRVVVAGVLQRRWSRGRR